MGKSKEISATMAIALAEATEHGGKLERHVGGYWAWPGAPRDHNGIPIDHWGTSTVEALIARGRMQYVTWREGARGRFPIVAEVVRE